MSIFAFFAWFAQSLACWSYMSATGLTANGKYRKIDTNYAGKKSKYLALHPTTGLCTRLLGFAPDYWALHPTTGLLPEYRGSGTFRERCQTMGNDSKITEILKIVEMDLYGSKWAENSSI